MQEITRPQRARGRPQPGKTSFPRAPFCGLLNSAERLVLSPAQQEAADGLIQGFSAGNIVLLRGETGFGRTTVLQSIHRELGGSFIGMREFMASLSRQGGGAIEESFLDLMLEALDHHHLVILDDLDLITDVVEGCNYPRANLFDAALTSLLSDAEIRGKKLLFAVEDDCPSPVDCRAYAWRIGAFRPDDYQAICRAYLSPQIADSLDYAKIHHFAPMLNAHQLRKAGVWLRRERNLDTERFIEYLRAEDLASNVRIEEVAKVDWNDLKGVDEVIEALEAKIALPFENDALAAELNLKPKRGVLLAGPPGTGKTTIGRALAHRLKSKFFLIDGTMIAGTTNFYAKIREAFESARRNAPSIIFIDDADVLFDGESDRGLCRYLLTMLDGLESASSGRICVMMTAMEPSDLPAAVLRSGRVELWLEMRLPDEEARAMILRGKLSALPAPLGGCDATVLAEASQGLTGADLNAVVEDGKLLFAYDKARGRCPRSPEDYFLEAIATIRKNRRSYAKRKPSPLVETMRIGFAVEEPVGPSIE